MLSKLNPSISFKPWLNNQEFKLVFFLILLASTQFCQGQERKTIHLSDIDHFWQAYDSIQITNDTTAHIGLMQRLYIDRGTTGLRAFMELRNFDAERLVATMYDYPRFWKSIRPNTFLVKDKEEELEGYIDKFKAIYPKCRRANIYFTITAIRSGGTTKDSLVLIGTEIATGNAQTDVSEFPDKRLENFFKTQEEDNIIPFAIHEYVHTQQSTEGKTLLGQAIYEGACDFITELVLEKPLRYAYIEYGKANEKAIKVAFQKAMFQEDYSHWIYNGTTADTVGDLGYYMGYVICKSYYSNASDKKQAVKEIIELDYSNLERVETFLTLSKYY